VASRVIAIDGPAGSGKSTTAKAVAARLDLAHIDSGSLYRAVTLAGLDAGVPLEGDLLVEAAGAKRVELREVEDGLRPIVAGVDVSKEIRSARVTEHVSAVSALPAVRTWVTDALRRAVARHPRGAVADGRDIGTVVFPDAVLKIFLTAAIGERARRRALEEGSELAPEGLQRLAGDMERRDTMDSTRAISPLKEAADAVRIDTTNVTFDEQVEAVVERAKPYFSAA
jgi:cytidylate kinase